MLKLKDLSTEAFSRSLISPQLVSTFNEGRAIKKMKIDNETFIDLLGRAGAVSPECKLRVIDMATEGRIESELLRTITDMATEPPDANDKGGLEKGTGLKKDAKGIQRGVITSFDGIEDKDFFAGLCRPNFTAITA